MTPGVRVCYGRARSLRWDPDRVRVHVVEAVSEDGTEALIRGVWVPVGDLEVIDQ